MPLNWHRRQLREIDAQIDNCSHELQRLKAERQALESDSPTSPVFQEDIAPPIPDINEGAFSFILNICWWAVYIAFKLAGYAILIWFVWTVLTV